MSATLESLGWKFTPPNHLFPGYWAKRYPDNPSCHCNHTKPGVIIQITPSRSREHTGYEIELCAEKPDGVWVRLICYGIGEELLTVLDSQIEQLLTAWKALNP